jgi:hypothetical protein
MILSNFYSLFSLEVSCLHALEEIVWERQGWRDEMEVVGQLEGGSTARQLEGG